MSSVLLLIARQISRNPRVPRGLWHHLFVAPDGAPVRLHGLEPFVQFALHPRYDLGMLRAEIVLLVRVVVQVEEQGRRRIGNRARGLGVAADVGYALRLVFQAAIHRPVLRGYLHCLGNSRSHELPGAVAHGGVAGPHRRVTVPLPEAPRVNLSVLAAENRKDIVTIELAICRGLRACHGRQRRQPVGEMDEVVDLSSAVQSGRPAENRRHADAAFVHQTLAAVEVSVVAGRAHIVLAAELRAVIAREKHERVFG